MSLELYHWEPNGHSARVLICLKEKGLDFVSHYVDVLAFEQHSSQFLKLSPRGQVPVLVHDGAVLTESSYINEYLEESFPEPRLMPGDALGRWRVRAWLKFADERLAPAVGLIGWHLGIGGSIRARIAGGTAELLDRIPSKERRDVWAIALDADATRARVAEARPKLEGVVAEIETALRPGAAWLAGSQYSLADIAVFPMIRALAELLPSQFDAHTVPRICEWLDRMQERPAVRASQTFACSAQPYRVLVPGPEQIRWG